MLKGKFASAAVDRGRGGLCDDTKAVAEWKKLTGKSHTLEDRRTVIGFAGVEMTFNESDIVFSKIPIEDDGSGTCVYVCCV